MTDTNMISMAATKAKPVSCAISFLMLITK